MWGRGWTDDPAFCPLTCLTRLPLLLLLRALTRSQQRIAAVRRMIAATELDSPAKAEALEELKNYQREDFEGIFRWAADRSCGLLKWVEVGRGLESPCASLVYRVRLMLL